MATRKAGLESLGRDRTTLIQHIVCQLPLAGCDWYNKGDNRTAPEDSLSVTVLVLVVRVWANCT